MSVKEIKKIREKTWEELQNIWDEYVRARDVLKHSKFNSYHEAISVIREEFDELWDQIKWKKENRRHDKIRTEATQLGAMVLAFLVELTE